MIKNLYDEIAKRWFHGGSIWFYSDPHFGDIDSYAIRFPCICRKSGAAFRDKDGKYVYPSELTPELVKYFDEWQVKNINSKLGRDDTIVFLGDIGDIEYIKKIRGYKVLILGNHDHGESYYMRHVTETWSSEDLSDEDRNIFVKAGMDMLSGDANKARRALEISKSIQKKYTKVNDNHLFDEVYSGVLMISDKIMLSHEPVSFKYAFNIHGHDHAMMEGYDDEGHFNCCAEHIDYTPVNINTIINSGKLKNIVNIHRDTIDNAIKRNNKKFSKDE